MSYLTPEARELLLATLLRFRKEESEDWVRRLCDLIGIEDEWLLTDWENPPPGMSGRVRYWFNPKLSREILAARIWWNSCESYFYVDIWPDPDSTDTQLNGKAMNPEEAKTWVNAVLATTQVEVFDLQEDEERLRG